MLKVRVPEVLVLDRLLLIRARKADYAELVGTISHPLTQMRSHWIEGVDREWATVRACQLGVRFAALALLPILYFAVTSTAWSLLALLPWYFTWGRLNYNQREANEIIAAHVIAFDYLMEIDPDDSESPFREAAMEARRVVEQLAEQGE